MLLFLLYSKKVMLTVFCNSSLLATMSKHCISFTSWKTNEEIKIIILQYSLDFNMGNFLSIYLWIQGIFCVFHSANKGRIKKFNFCANIRPESCLVFCSFVMKSKMYCQQSNDLFTKFVFLIQFLAFHIQWNKNVQNSDYWNVLKHLILGSGGALLHHIYWHKFTFWYLFQSCFN